MKLILSLLIILSSLASAAQSPTISELLARDGVAGDQFGISVAISGDYVIVGATELNLFDGYGNPGAAYIFKKNGETWEQQAKLLPSDGHIDNGFGHRVDISGDYAVVTAPDQDPSDDIPGATYIFFRSGDVWTQEAKLKIPPLESGPLATATVAISGEYIVIGSYSAVSIFKRNSDNTWSLQKQLISSTPLNSTWISTDISGNQIVIGENNFDQNLGRVHVFENVGTDWVEKATLTTSNGSATFKFGWSVAIAGNQIIVGDYLSNNVTGAAYIFEKENEVWVERKKLVADDGTIGDFFGSRVDISEDYAIVGANGARGYMGAAYVFKKTGSDWNHLFKIIGSNDQIGDQLGSSVTTDGTEFLTGAYLAYDEKGKVLVTSLPSCSQSTLSASILDGYAVYPGGAANTIYLGYGPSSLTFEADASGGTPDYTYNWNSPYNNVIVQATIYPNKVTVTPDAAGAYTLTVTAVDANGCEASYTKTYYVVDIRSDIKKGKIWICHRDLKGKWITLSVLASSVSDHLAHGDYLGICNINSSSSEFLTRAASETGGQKIIPKAFKIFPNPATHFLDVQWKTTNTSQTSIRILNAEGKTVKTITTQGAVNHQRISLNGLARGVYMLVLKTGADQQVSKFVIQ